MSLHKMIKQDELHPAVFNVVGVLLISLSLLPYKQDIARAQFVCI